MNNNKRSAQATEPSYELHTLGWKAFQHLCLTIASEIWGQTVQGYHDSRDGGRDGAFYGTWTPKQGDTLSGSFTVQCKFSAENGKSLAVSDLKDELKKAERLASRGLADNYILFTNQRLSGVVDEQLRRAFEAVPGIKRFLAYGGERVCQFIRESARLRMLVPRVYGLGDLSQILDERAQDQALEILSALGDDLAKFVITHAYRESATALVEHGFVLLLGEPACGKSAIAAALALGALDEWRCSTLKIRNADDFVKHSNPHEAKQFFWIDDAFGATQLDWQATVDWNRAFPHVSAALRRGAKFVLTSRDYIYRNARNFLKESALPVLNESQVIIHVEQLTKDEREQILYNHIRLGSQSKEFKTEIKPFLKAVAANARFSPELARRLGHPTFTKGLHLAEWSLAHFVEHPLDFLKEIIRTLDAPSRSAIALVFMRDGMLASPVSLTSDEREAIALLGASAADLTTALSSLEGSLLLQVQQRGAFYWRFKHPTIRDAFGSLVAENRELMDIYLRGTPVGQLLYEISCGDITIEGAKVIVAGDRYDTLCGRIEKFWKDRHENENAVHTFLASRCDRAFLVRFLERNPDLIPGLQVGSYFYAVTDVDVINRLQEFGLLPEPERKRHLDAVRELAARTPDSGFLDRRTVSFISEEERADILNEVRTKLLPLLELEVDNWRDNYSGGDEPSAYFDTLKSTLNEFGKALPDDTTVSLQIAQAMDLIDEAVSELETGIPDHADSDHRDYSSRSPVSEGSDGARSVFEDVDQ